MNTLIQTTLLLASSPHGRISVQLVQVLLMILSISFKVNNASLVRRYTMLLRREQVKMQVKMMLKIMISMLPGLCVLMLKFMVRMITGRDLWLSYVFSSSFASLSADSLSFSEEERQPGTQMKTLNVEQIEQVVKLLDQQVSSQKIKLMKKKTR